MCSSYLATWFLLAASIHQVESESPAVPDAARQTVILVVGASGEEEYGNLFRQSADRWEEVAKAAPIRLVRIGDTSLEQPNDLAQLERTLADEPKDYPEPLWIVMLGHGTFDGRQAKFNLRGPDLTAEQLEQWIKPFQRTLIILNGASASSPFMNQLAGENRVVITSTKSGYQYNFARFGLFLSQTIGDAGADLDKDGQTSLLEAYLMASSRVDEFYRQESRLATEEALLDDNGDGLGTPGKLVSWSACREEAQRGRPRRRNVRAINCTWFALNKNRTCRPSCGHVAMHWKSSWPRSAKARQSWRTTNTTSSSCRS